MIYWLLIDVLIIDDLLATLLNHVLICNVCLWLRMIDMLANDCEWLVMIMNDY